MEQSQAQEHRLKLPWAIEGIVFATLLFACLSPIFSTTFVVKPHTEELASRFVIRGYDVVLSYLGHNYVLTGPLSMAASTALALAGYALVFTSAVFLHKGRMWAYYVLLLASVSSVVLAVSDIVARQMDQMSWLPFLVVWVLVRNFREFREYARSRR